ncbi:uncharacterized protein BP5553_10000 [Venustampulla echinocandica]|uniref:Uncharacterized protein n=1 Tax=Venustampulla echinocandica TaxID=2656787 RepID=A0A370TA29_9HELO|nr:uncharacterized protein BP5553_10000 [Venustampulla echinocandica]RDL30655.1 hypothetical protein BP5553_10000 [Venustampulla echinocandica]
MPRIWDLDDPDAQEPKWPDQQHVGNSTDRTSAQPSGHPDDVSNLHASVLWRHFELTKRSAIFHVDQYLVHRESVRQEPGDWESASLDVVPQNTDQVPKSFWSLKVSRDSLLNELSIMSGLLDYMSIRSTKGLPKLYSIIVILTVALILAGYDRTTATKVAWGMSIAALVPTVAYTLHKTSWFISIALCKPATKRMYERARGNTLDATDSAVIKGIKFELLWMTSLFNTDDPDDPGDY